MSREAILGCVDLVMVLDVLCVKSTPSLGRLMMPKCHNGSEIVVAGIPKDPSNRVPVLCRAFYILVSFLLSHNCFFRLCDFIGL